MHDNIRQEHFPPRRAFKMQMQILEQIPEAAKMKKMHS